MSRVRGHRITLAFRGKHLIQVRTTIVDDELAAVMRELLDVPKGSRVFRYEWRESSTRSRASG